MRECVLPNLFPVPLKNARSSARRAPGHTVVLTGDRVENSSRTNVGGFSTNASDTSSPAFLNVGDALSGADTL